MKEVFISAKNTREIIEQIQQSIGGEIIDSFGKSRLVINNNVAKGTIRVVTFDWGVNLMIFNITFYDEITLKIKATEFNPVRFIYNLKGEFYHRFGINSHEEMVEQFQTLITTNKIDGFDYLKFKKDLELDINIIQIIRKDFLKKRTTKVSSLNKKLQNVFVDTDYENRFAHYGALNLKWQIL